MSARVGGQGLICICGRRRYTLAAESGHSKAQYNLGMCYESGKGIKQDMVSAVRWYTEAANNKHPKAANNLGVCYQARRCLPLPSARVCELRARLRTASKRPAPSRWGALLCV